MKHVITAVLISLVASSAMAAEVKPNYADEHKDGVFQKTCYKSKTYGNPTKGFACIAKFFSLIGGGSPH